MQRFTEHIYDLSYYHTIIHHVELLNVSAYAMIYVKLLFHICCRILQLNSDKHKFISVNVFMIMMDVYLNKQEVRGRNILPRNCISESMI